MRSRASSVSSLALAGGVGLLLVSLGCASANPGGPVRFLRNESDAAGCQKVGDVAAAPYLPDTEVVGSIADEARKKGADTVVLAKGERKGTAFRCEAPRVADR